VPPELGIIWGVTGNCAAGTWPENALAAEVESSRLRVDRRLLGNWPKPIPEIGQSSPGHGRSDTMAQSEVPRLAAGADVERRMGGLAAPLRLRVFLAGQPWGERFSGRLGAIDPSPNQCRRGPGTSSRRGSGRCSAARSRRRDRQGTGPPREGRAGAVGARPGPRRLPRHLG